jgi:biotin-dependent carboxylase-like uncharacterized protein
VTDLALRIRACGPSTSLQDLGRIGLQRLGISPAGAMDRPSLMLANALAGNPPGEAAIEFGLLGGDLACEGGPVRVGFAGAAMALSVDGTAVPAHASLTLRAGQVLRIAPATKGVFGYLAVAGGFDVPAELGSRSLHRRSGIGGLGGRLLREDDRLPVRVAAEPGGDRVLTALLPTDKPDAPVRIVLGPQQDHVSEEGLATLLSQPFAVSPRSDRMAYRLVGPPIGHARGYNIVSDGIATGSIQIAGTGEPLLLLADRQTTGGYPKIATVISADLPRVVQTQGGGTLRFRAVEIAEAVAAARATDAAMRARLAAIRVMPADWRASDWLLAQNLVDGVVADGL